MLHGFNTASSQFAYMMFILYICIFVNISCYLEHNRMCTGVQLQVIAVTHEVIRQEDKSGTSTGPTPPFFSTLLSGIINDRHAGLESPRHVYGVFRSNNSNHPLAWCRFTLCNAKYFCLESSKQKHVSCESWKVVDSQQPYHRGINHHQTFTGLWSIIQPCTLSCFHSNS